MDIATNDEDGNPWGFTKEEPKRKAVQTFIETEPDLVVGSPLCRDYSPWQRLNVAKSSEPEKFAERKKESDEHLKFVTEVYNLQYYAGRLFLHEHPAGASSWDEQCVKEVLAQLGGETTITDQCQFGQRSREGNPIRKPTKWMSNCQEMLESLDKRCTGRGCVCSKTGMPHATCSGRTAKEAAI